MPDGLEPDDVEIARADEEESETAQLVTLARPSELLPGEIRDVSFGFALGGYSRSRVDAYVEEVKRVVAELEVSRSPGNAVKLALDRVGEQTTGILQEAREAAEELTAGSVAEAEHVSRRARVEAEELMRSAQEESRALRERSTAESDEILLDARARLQELRTEIEEARAEHERVLGELRATAAAIDAFATRAERPDEQPTEAIEAVSQDGAGPSQPQADARPAGAPPA